MVNKNGWVTFSGQSTREVSCRNWYCALSNVLMEVDRGLPNPSWREGNLGWSSFWLRIWDVMCCFSDCGLPLNPSVVTMVPGFSFYAWLSAPERPSQPQLANPDVAMQKNKHQLIATKPAPLEFAQRLHQGHWWVTWSWPDWAATLWATKEEWAGDTVDGRHPFRTT